MGAAPLRSLGDLSLDRGDLYAVHHATEGQLFRHRGSDRGVVFRDHRHRAEDRAAGPVRPAGDRPLPRHGLERHDALRRRGGEAADTDAGFHARGRRIVYLRRDFPCLAAAALPERDLAWLRLARRGLPLYGYTRPDRFDVKKIRGRAAMQVTGNVRVVTGGGNGSGKEMAAG